MSKVSWIVFSAIIVAVLGGLIIYSRVSNPSANVSTVNANAAIPASEASGQIADQVYGKTDSQVVLVEYGDFQCPSCAGAHPQIKTIMEEYKDKVAFIYRNFPLTSIHPNAKIAAAAAEAAGLQGKYWDMHNLIYESQAEWKDLTGTERTNAFAAYAETIGLDKERFLSDIAGTAVNRKISFDQALGKKVGVNSTPSFYLNGEALPEAVSSAIVQGSTTELKDLFDQKLGN
ncbi:thioredoxin domain-containing protein [Candidatus Saccharibacteria bacterium]|nr:thioredoxin domain-containing protein [Candidatus Saccharibacteria bacterium]